MRKLIFILLLIGLSVLALSLTACGPVALFEFTCKSEPDNYGGVFIKCPGSADVHLLAGQDGKDGFDGRDGKDGKDGRDSDKAQANLNFNLTNAQQCENGGYALTIFQDVDNNGMYDPWIDGDFRTIEICNGLDGKSVEVVSDKNGNNGNHYGHGKGRER